MTSHRYREGEPPDAVPSPADELRHDRRRERLLLWKGVFALAVVVAVVWVRQRYLL